VTIDFLAAHEIQDLDQEAISAHIRLERIERLHGVKLSLGHKALT
jgi:hypothetical protein